MSGFPELGGQLPHSAGLGGGRKDSTHNVGTVLKHLTHTAAAI